jgi:uncharacterized protein YjbI with pentapeptide repeats
MEDVNISGARIINANLTNVSISDVALTGMTINGIPVTDLLASHQTMQALISVSTSNIEDLN